MPTPTTRDAGTLAAARHARAARDAAEVALARATVDYCAAHSCGPEDAT